jgi:aspartate aminotransferase, cytoplasmic
VSPTSVSKLPESENEFSFDIVPVAPGDPVFAVAHACHADPYPLKINLSIGAYRDSQGNPWVLPVVTKVCAVRAI